VRHHQCEEGILSTMPSREGRREDITKSANGVAPNCVWTEKFAAEIWVGRSGEADALHLRAECPRFLLERYEPAPDERPEVVLSRRVQSGELQGFVLIDPDILRKRLLTRPIAYHTDEPTFNELPNWIEEQVNEEVLRRRYEEADLDGKTVQKLSKRVNLSTWGLVKQRDDGTVEEADQENELRTFGIPFVGLMLMFMMVMTAAPQLMNQVLEEKMQRISEVLVSAVTPFQLMLGKLLGGVGTAGTLALLYLGGVVFALNHFGVGHFVPWTAYLWFVVMMVFALLMYGSLFSAMGSACSELRDAQTLMMPAMVLVMVPMFAFTVILESPNGDAARWLTYFPTATPLVFLLRVLAPPGPAAWEYPAALAMCVVTTVALVWASGRIFRIGVLAQGQTPTLAKLLRWVFTS
jgi:ABC-type Na+ efflux pump permease subunit